MPIRRQCDEQRPKNLSLDTKEYLPPVSRIKRYFSTHCVRNIKITDFYYPGVFYFYVNCCFFLLIKRLWGAYLCICFNKA